MNVEIIAVGSELLLGQIVNSNAKFLSEKLAEIGANVYFHTVVGDNPKRLKRTLEIASERSDCLILTGGLGPTKDDLTRNVVADFVGTTLEVNDEALENVKSFFDARNVVMTDNNINQAVVLKGAKVFPNNNGLAVGMAYEMEDGKTVILLPGPPKEMIPMYMDSVLPYLQGKSLENQIIKSRVLRFFGIGESTLETMLIDIIEKQTNPTVAPLAGDGEVTLRLTALTNTHEHADEMLDDTEHEILEVVGVYFYGYDETSLLKEFVKVLKENGLTVSVAESITGGMLQGQLTDISGASAFFNGGVVTYSTQSKINVLGVDAGIIEAQGVVSPACAEEMAIKVREKFGTDIGISLTGVAGPTELEGKAVGTVFIGLSVRNEMCVSRKVLLGKNRDFNRLLATKHALKFATDTISKNR